MKLAAYSTVGAFLALAIVNGILRPSIWAPARALGGVAVWWILVAVVALYWSHIPTFRRTPKHYVDLVTDDQLMDTFGWKDSLKIVIRTVLLALLTVAFFVAGDVSLLTRLLVAIPIVAYGVWLVVEAMPEERPDWWLDPDVVGSFSRDAFVRYLYHGAALVTVFIVVLLLADGPWWQFALALILLLAFVAPMLVGGAVVVWCALILCRRHWTNARDGYRAAWARRPER